MFLGRGGMANNREAKSMRERAQRRTLAEFGALGAAEQELLEACRTGEFAWIADERPKEKSNDNSVRPAFLRFLALGADDDCLLHEKGVQLHGAWIDGDIDLECCRIGSDIRLFSCAIAGKLNVRSADLHGLLLDGSTTEGIIGDSLRCRGNLHLRDGFHATGEVSLPHARIRGVLDCTNGNFDGAEGPALACDGIEAGSVFLRDGFRATGVVRMAHSRTRGNLDCAGGRFDGGKGPALLCFSGRFDGSVYLRDGFNAIGQVNLNRAHIRDNLECSGGRFDGTPGSALFCDGIQTGGNIFLRNGFHAIGEVRLAGARIGGNLDCDRGQFETTGDYSLLCNRARIEGALQLRELGKAEPGKAGVVALLSAEATTFTDDAASWTSAKALILDGFTYERITGVPRTDEPGGTIFGSAPPRDANTRIAWLECQPPHHLKQDFRPQPWLQLARVLMEMGHEDDARTVLIEMRKLQRGSRWKYRDAWWKQTWWFVLTRFDWVLGALVAYGYRPHRAMWSLLGLWLAGSLIYWGVASAGIMAPTDAHFYLDERIAAECKVDWIGFAGPRLPTRNEIAKADDDVSRARLQKQIFDDADRRQHEAKRVGLDTTQDWPWKSICNHAMPSEYSVFQPFVYSIDIMLPFLELRQERDFAPRVLDDKRNVIRPLFTLPSWLPLIGGTWGLGYLVRVWEWFEIFFGWTLTILIAASVSGIIKKD
jgi:hypothetical protein